MTELKLPDFDEMLDMANDIGGLTRDISIAKSQLNSELAAITRIVIQDEKYWTGSKAPAMNYIISTYHADGYSEESRRRLEELRNNIAGMEGDLEYAKNKFKIYSAMIDVWKANQYNLNQSQY
jgi:uncharacterized protein YukE